MTVKDILKLYHKIGLQTNTRDAFIKEIIESQFKFTKDKIANLRFEVGLKEEEYKKIKTNFTFKYLGKMYTSFRIINDELKRKEKYGEKYREKYKR